jgi:transcription termination factor Rho
MDERPKHEERNSMSGEQLERSILERKASDELRAIAAAMSLEPASRLKKADLVDQILRAAGVEVAGAPAGGGGNGNGNGSGSGIAEVPANGSVTGDAAGDGGEGAKATKPRSTRTRATRKVAGPEADETVGTGAGAEETGSEAGRSAMATTVAELTATMAEPEGEGGAPDSGGSLSDSAASGGAASGGAASGGAASGGAAESGSALNGASSEGAQGQNGPRTQNRPQRDRQQGDRQQRDRQQGERQQGGGPQGDRGEGSRGEGAGQGNGNAGPGNQQGDAGNRRSRRRRGRDREREPQGQGGQADAPYSGELVPVKGLLDLRDEGYGFLRTSGYLPSQKDVYVSLSQARRFGLRRGDAIEGGCRPAGPSEKYPALLRIDSICGMTPEEAARRPRFEDLTPLFPDSRLHLEMSDDPTNVTARIVDLISPIGKGQRGLIVSPPKAGKTTVLKQIAHSIEANNPDVHLMVLLVDERPEEVTDMRRSVKGEVIASTFDRPADEHTLVSELAIERAKRLVELGRDVVIVLDGITRLARAYNLAQPATGRIMSGGVDSGALYPPKKFFGAARNIEEGGSLTILATALVETGSKMDEVIFEEFKGTGNMELRLDRRLAERRIYPAIDVNASSTRHEELLFQRGQLQQVWKLRRVLNALGAEGNSGAGLELLMDKIKTTRSNDEFLLEIAKAPSPSA